jgi:hypothetical protein
MREYFTFSTRFLAPEGYLDLTGRFLSYNENTSPSLALRTWFSIVWEEEWFYTRFSYLQDERGALYEIGGAPLPLGREVPGATSLRGGIARLRFQHGDRFLEQQLPLLPTPYHYLERYDYEKYLAVTEKEVVLGHLPGQCQVFPLTPAGKIRQALLLKETLYLLLVSGELLRATLESLPSLVRVIGDCVEVCTNPNSKGLFLLDRRGVVRWVRV